jgi:hypothetical protein
MTFATIEAAQRAADRFERDYGGGCYRYRIEPDHKGFVVTVMSDKGTFLTYV